MNVLTSQGRSLYETFHLVSLEAERESNVFLYRVRQATGH